MRYGIISDTHANLPALKAVLTALESEGIDRLACLGDTVGYGPLPNECCELIREKADFVVLGNHDAAVAGRMDYSYYYDAAREALDYHSSLLSPQNLEWLKGLPYKQEDGAVHFCHGSPVDLEQFEYIFSVEQAETCLPVWNELGDITFIGHSHLCKSFAVAIDRGFEVVTRDFGLRDGFRYIVSVGSVGQPRDHDPRASYGVYDSTTKQFKFGRVAYDIESVAQKIFESQRLSDGFGTRLFAGV